MPISKDLFLALLAMDSYNRGYGAGISDQGGADADGLGVTTYSADGTPLNEYFIGNAKIVEDKGDAEAQAAGFYAVAYEVNGVDGITDGTTVISYRGTDFAPDEGLGNDMVFGGGTAPIYPYKGAVL